MHPDDLLDEDRGADLGWAVLKENLDDYMGWIDESAVNIRHLTGAGMAGAVQRYVNLTPNYKIEEGNISLTSKGIIDTAFYLIRANDGERTYQIKRFTISFKSPVGKSYDHKEQVTIHENLPYFGGKLSLHIRRGIFLDT